MKHTPFMDELVTIVIHSTSEKGGEKPVVAFRFVDGDLVTDCFKRDVLYSVKRDVLSAFLERKVIVYRRNKKRISTVTKFEYPVEVLKDSNPAGRKWLMDRLQ